MFSPHFGRTEINPFNQSNLVGPNSEIALHANWGKLWGHGKAWNPIFQTYGELESSKYEGNTSMKWEMALLLKR